jgi:hypothetical protein
VLRESAGAGTVVGNLSEALTDLFGSVAREILGLLIFRDDLRARLREARPGRLPLLREATVMIAAYLAAEQELGRIAADADVGTLAATLIGAAHLQFAGRDETPPDAEAICKMVTTVIAGVAPERPARGRGDAGWWLEPLRRDTTAEAR